MMTMLILEEVRKDWKDRQIRLKISKMILGKLKLVLLMVMVMVTTMI